MPKGIPSTPRPQTTAGTTKLVIELNPADYEELARLAQNEYRTPALQAAYLLAAGLRLARTRGKEVDAKTQVERIVTYAAGKHNGDDSE